MGDTKVSTNLGMEAFARLRGGFERDKAKLGLGLANLIREDKSMIDLQIPEFPSSEWWKWYAGTPTRQWAAAERLREKWEAGARARKEEAVKQRREIWIGRLALLILWGATTVWVVLLLMLCKG